MKLMIASDLHGSALYCRKLLNAFASEKADRLLLLGDLLYHGPRNDLPEGYDPKAVDRPAQSVGRPPGSASAATATQKWIKWFWSSPFLPITPFSAGGTA